MNNVESNIDRKQSVWLIGSCSSSIENFRNWWYCCLKYKEISTTREQLANDLRICQVYLLDEEQLSGIPKSEMRIFLPWEVKLFLKGMKLDNTMYLTFSFLAYTMICDTAMVHFCWPQLRSTEWSNKIWLILIAHSGKIVMIFGI